MMLSPVYFILWSSLLFFWASQSETEADILDVCQTEENFGELLKTCFKQGLPVGCINSFMPDVSKNFLCLLPPTNIINCSWSFPTLQKDAELVVQISICDNEMQTHLNHSSKERVGLRYFKLPEGQIHAFLQFNISLQDILTVYTYKYEMEMLDVPSPPQNVSASIKDGDLVVTWGLPQSRVITECFEYQLELGGQERPIIFSNQLSHKEPNADPSRIYRVRMRTRYQEDCQDNPQWSDWSHVVTVEQSMFNTGVIISISLGVPMILLAVLLLVRYQRVSKVLFPPIPRPPPKYIHFLEKNDTFNIFYVFPKAEPVEEITEVEDTEQNPEK